VSSSKSKNSPSLGGSREGLFLFICFPPGFPPPAGGSRARSEAQAERILSRGSVVSALVYSIFSETLKKEGRLFAF